MPLEKGYYYVNADRQRGYGSYTIESEFIPVSYENDPEPNDTRETASLLEGSGTGRLGYYTESRPSVNGPVNVFDNDDFWKITVGNDGPIEFAAVAEEGLDITLHLYNGNGSWQKMATSVGTITTLAQTVYAGDYYILTEGVSGFGSYTITDLLAVETAVDDADYDAAPRQFAVHPPSPNPFNPQTTIRYELKSERHVSLVIYDINGREVIVLKDSMSGAGIHEAVWNGRNSDGQLVGSGMYLYKFKAGSFSDHGKMTLIK